MGKSGGKKKKGSSRGGSVPNPGAVESPNISTTTTADNKTSSTPANHPASPSVADILMRAYELKEDGNRLFQAKDYPRASEQYELALKLLPGSHPDRAVFHSNRAACLMQMRPVDYHAVAAECSLALQAQPRFPRALLRRARALEALGNHDLAFLDVQNLLASDPTNRDALELSSRLRQQPSRPSPAALGASAVRGAPIAGVGPGLPSRPVPKKSSPLPNGPKPTSPPPPPVSLKSVVNKMDAPPLPPPPPPPNVAKKQQNRVAKWRPLKLCYDHDIRLSEMPIGCTFGMLRNIVKHRFPSSKSVLIKFRDCDSDLVTITCTAELRAAELYVDQPIPMVTDGKKNEGNNNQPIPTVTDGKKNEGNNNQPIPMVTDGKKNEGNNNNMLRLYIVEVSPEQEPPQLEEEELQEEEEEEENPLENNGLLKGIESSSNSSNGNPDMECAKNNDPVKADSENKSEKQAVATTDNGGCNHAECKQTEIDDWLFDFAQLFRTHVGIDPEVHLDLHELGMELCTEALEETVTSEEAQELFKMAASKFQEVAALAFFNWGNVYMCAARKRIPLDDSASKEVMSAQLLSAYEWVQERYELARHKYEESLRIKPDFYEGLLALGQQHFENAKLQWSFAVANKVDLKTWDSSKTIQLFSSAEEKMKAATDMWEKFEEDKANELKDPFTNKMNELVRKKKLTSNMEDGQSLVDVQGDLSANETEEQAAVMRSQIHLFWGNMLFERSQVEYRLGFGGWKENLDAAVERFRLAGASESDISAVLKNHFSKETGVETDQNMTSDLANIAGASVKNEDKHVLAK